MSNSRTEAAPAGMMPLGTIVSPFGRRGEVKLWPDTDYPEQMLKRPTIALRLAKGPVSQWKVQQARMHKRCVVLKLEGIDSIDDAERLRSAVALQDVGDAAPLGEDEYYIHDLVGCEVLTPGGAPLGTVTGVLRTPANDVYVIRSQETEWLLPAIRQAVRNVDIAGKRITATPMPGILPESLADAAH
ncbi:MAG: 16S rRNA processing protein RimM [Armatimonadetes bacterium]|nr:16S rRNA processing protein RimM [Armatimonadota bacterium]MDE2205329.1 16S rRNA processing protein RimM [Armatimonadota bacterium]